MARYNRAGAQHGMAIAAELRENMGGDAEELQGWHAVSVASGVRWLPAAARSSNPALTR
jgi:hypothetical protein